MSTMIKTVCAGMLAVLAGMSNADAAAVSPGYLGAGLNYHF
jgi:hypothetical protein